MLAYCLFKRNKKHFVGKIVANGQTVDHNHSADPNLVELKQFQANIKHKALDNCDLPLQIFSSTLKDIAEFAQPHIRRSNIFRNVRRLSHVANIESANPSCLIDLIMFN